MSQKRSAVAAFPPTEGLTEDTDVILEPTTAVPKRARTTRTRGATSNADGGADDLIREEGAEGEDDDEEDTKPAAWAVKRTPNTSFPAHLNPTDPAHFDHFLFQLLAVRAETNSGGFNIFKDEYPTLYAWLQVIKKEYKLYSNGSPTTSLTAQQVLVLESLHVPLTSRGDEHWNRYYDLLQQYQQRHGHVLVPRVCEVPGLGDWVTDQRRQYKAKHHGQSSQMTDARQHQLEQLGFVWHVRNRPEWEVRFTELVEYKAANGDCKVPQHYKPNRSLGKWVAKQREQYKLRLKGQHSFLTPYREEKLNSIGFSWFVRSALDSEVQSALEEVSAPLPSVASVDEDAAPSVKVEEEVATNASAAATGSAAIKEEQEEELMLEEKTVEI
jgi:Helicase associated domain